MLSVAAAIRSIRKRLGESTTEFARRLGVGQSTISKYELNRVTPSRSTLLLLLPLAESKDEKRAIAEALGGDVDFIKVREAQLERDIAAAQAEMKAILDQERRSPGTRRWMLGLALQIARHPEIPLWLPTILSLWQRYYANPRMGSLMTELAEKMIARIRDEEVRWELQSPNDRPQRVMIRCPERGLPVFTGLTVTGQEFAVGSFNRMEVFCPHCHITHTWNKPDAFLEGAI